MNSCYPEGLSVEERGRLGMVFTDFLISSFIVDRAVHYLSKDWFKDKVTIVEPSVGGGSFYIALLQKMKRQLESRQQSPRKIEELLSSVYAMDIEDSAVRLAKENIAHSLETTGVKSRGRWKENIFCRDFLLAGREDFGAESEGIDLIIGNPPYIGEKGHKELFRRIKETPFGHTYYEKGMDYFYYFIEKGLQLLGDGGILAYITTSYWMKADSASKLREFIRREAGFRELVDFQNLKPFKDADGHNSVVFILQKGYTGKFAHYAMRCKKKQMPAALNQIQEQRGRGLPEDGLLQRTVCDNQSIQRGSPYFVFLPKEEASQIQRIEECSDRRLRQIARINQGIVSGADRVTKQNLALLSESQRAREHIQIGDGIFVLSEKEKTELCELAGEEMDCICPFYKNSSISAYQVGVSAGYLIYLDGKGEVHPVIIEHLQKFRPILERRREVVKGSIPYYALQWSREKSIFESEKIVVPQRAFVPVFARSDDKFYASADVYFINRIQGDVYFLLGYLNSSIVEFYLRHLGKRKGLYYELYARPLGEIPLLHLDESTKRSISMLAKKAENTQGDPRRDARQKIDDLLEEAVGIQVRKRK